jgi:hypothetical protein
MGLNLIDRMMAGSQDYQHWKRRQAHQVTRNWRESIASDHNPLLRAGAKYFSQFDEDGIILEIARRINLTAGTFLEIGVGDGLENNTINLMAHGWTGQWIGGEALAWQPTGHRLHFTRSFVTADNVLDLVGSRRYDLMSLDIDGNDYWIAQRLLTRLEPSIVVVEYNAKFPPPVKFVMPYRQDHQWSGDDYFGASLMAWVDLFEDYRLVACSYMGLNAFFVRRESPGFDDVPTDPSTIYRPPLYVAPIQVGHATSPRTIATIEATTIEKPSA